MENMEKYAAMDSLMSWALPLFIIFILAEIIISAKDQLGLYKFRDTRANVLLGLFALVSGTLSKVVSFEVFTFFHNLASLDLGFGWPVILCCFIADDWAHYAFHRFGHRFRIGWAAHVTHHNSEKYNLSVALRLPLHLFYRFLFWIPLSFFFDPGLILFMDAVSQVYQFFLHTEVVKKLGPLEWIFNTPSHHRVHHAKNPQYIDKNYGGVLIIWDRLLGTFAEEKETPVYGITKPVDGNNPVKAATHGWMELFSGMWKQKSLGAAFRYMFSKPD